MERFEPAALGGREVVGEAEGTQIRERLPELSEALLQVAGARRQHRRGRRRSHHAERVLDELLAVALVGNAVGVNQRERLAGTKVVARHGREHGVLVVVRERAQRVRQRRADGAAAELVLGRERQARAQGETTRHPRGLAAEQARHACRREPVLLDQRAHDPRFVQRGERARRRVGHQQPALVLGARAGTLDDHGRLLAPGFSRARQALEAVEHLVVPVLGGHDPQRHLGQVVGLRPWRTRPQRLVACAQARWRYQTHRAGRGHRRTAGRQARRARTDDVAQKGASSSGRPP
ncbi:MAG: hypothetical protein HY723_02395 [Chloroflexi bacterium]|nr:hypothetical protein [Chloroflexota bacterium]